MGFSASGFGGGGTKAAVKTKLTPTGLIHTSRIVKAPQ